MVPRTSTKKSSTICSTTIEVRVLGLDPSMRNFGWAVVDTQAQARRRLVTKGTFHTDADDFFLDRYEHLEAELTALLERRSTIRIVSMEAADVFGASYSEGAYALYVIAMRVLRAARRDVVLFGPLQLKALARGYMGGPEMSKADMVEAVKRLVARRNEFHVKLRINNHEADATIAGWYGARFFELLCGELTPDDLSGAEQHMFLRERQITKGPRKGMSIRKGLTFREGDRYFLFSES